MVAAITSFYKFQTGMHSNKNASCDFDYPPPTGWPEVKGELFSGYDDTVVDLIRHLPYIDNECLFILPDTAIVGHASPNSIRWKTEARMRAQQEASNKLHAAVSPEVEVQNGTKDDDVSNDEPDFPEYMLDLAAGGQYGSTILVDTKHNTIIWWEYGDGCRDIPQELRAKYPGDCWLSYSKEGAVEESDDLESKPKPSATTDNNSEEPDDDVSDDGESDFDEEWDRIYDSYYERWKTSPAYSPEDFFEMCKEQFRIMNWMPVLHSGCRGKVIELYRHQVFEGENLRMMQIMRAAGWPGDGEAGGWDKAAAEEAMERMELEDAEERAARKRGIERDLPLNQKWKSLVIREGSR